MARRHKSSPVAGNYIARAAVFIPSLLVSTFFIHCQKFRLCNRGGKKFASVNGVSWINAIGFQSP